MRRSQIAVVSVATALATVLAPAVVSSAVAGEGGAPAASPPLFATSDKCLACHNGMSTPSGEDVSIGSAWRASIMANAARDPYWQAAVRREIVDHPAAATAIQDECATCHAPMARFEAHTSGRQLELFSGLGGGPRGVNGDALALLYPADLLSFEQVESAVLNVARYDVFKLSEAVLAGQAAHVQRMLDGLRAEGEAEVLVHYTLSEDIRALKRVKDAMSAGRPLPMALREQRVWGLKERLFERVLPRLTATTLDNLLHSAHLVDGIVKGLKAPDWPTDGWQALHRLAFALCRECAPLSPSPSGRGRG